MNALRRRIARLRALLSRATGHPWHIEAVPLDKQGKAQVIEEHPSWHNSPWHTVIGWSSHDRELVQNAVAALPDLLDLLDRQEDALRQVRARLQSTLEHAHLVDVSGLEEALVLIDSLLVTDEPRRAAG
jgi:hypothetical protein